MSLSSSCGLSMPYEALPHLRTLTAWPDAVSQESTKMLRGAELDVAAIANAIVDFEPVTLYCKPSSVAKASSMVSPKVDIQPLNVTELWMRDTGPVFARNDATGSLVGLDFNFNYWGKKYKGKDGSVAADILANMGVPRVQAPFVAEGGAIEVDGDGTLLLTESSVLNSNRNPGVSKAKMEEYFAQTLGVSKVLWVKGAKGKDITDWHIDAMARFVEPGKVLLSKPPAGSDKFVVDIYKQAKQVLDEATDAKGRRLQVLTLDEADPALFDDVDPYSTVLSYLNYLVVNGGVIIPSFGDDAADNRANDLFKELFPDRKVVGVRLNALRKLGGGIHCATQQVPKL